MANSRLAHGFVSLLVAAVWPLLTLGESAKNESGCAVEVDISELKEGGAKEIFVGGKPVHLVMMSPKDSTNLQELAAQVFEESTNKPIDLGEGRFLAAVVPISPYSSCKVEYISRSENKMHWTEAQWLGGYHSPCHSELFDLLGRQIRPGRFSPTEFPKFIGNLPFPNVQILSATRIEVSL